MCNFNLTKPCKDCPFNYTKKGYLSEARAKEIGEALLYGDQTFTCHKTNSFDEEGNTVETEKSEHCAGAMIFLEAQDRPNQMMRISERLGLYDRTKLDMRATVFDGLDLFVEHHAIGSGR